MPHWIRTQGFRRCRLGCIVIILAINIFVLAAVFESPRLISKQFVGIMYSRIFHHQHKCDLNLTQHDWSFDNTTTWEMLEKELSFNLKPGGRYKPDIYDAENDIVVVVPYRNREIQLKTFIRYMHPYLQRKQLSYKIVVVEMTPGVDFNRAVLLNAGFVESLKVRDQQQCFIFHDVDLLPESICTPYNCERSPLHMAVAMDIHNYTLPYPSFFGGICAIKREHFQRINGLSNQYFGWGGEDDDFHSRLKLSGLHVNRLAKTEGRYHMLSHAPEKQNPLKIALFEKMRARIEVDGLNSLKYDIVKHELKPLYTWILVEVNYTTV